MQRSSYETAVLVALALKRFERTRVRLSGIRLKKISGRKQLRSVFVQAVIEELNDMGVLMIELENGGFGLTYASVLEGAPALPVARAIGSELRDLRSGELSLSDIESELFQSDGEDDDDDDD
ncbi:hypothetical protein [Thalassolituus alkanivorans]|uniref:hypothetical protein n=1 Tax=Thalassolituus alkanivorans TaxID=2881055 RepID=UPI001E4602E7|nr:hypothetical protein [Thalassolituus alkanivorans]MCB2385576.1 hypothetical protein [Thalassolituus alkanivorans]MCB2421510.1 hypothetical protein [Thalassolituus alkanivorans]